MGLPMAQNLMRAGFTLNVHSRTKAKAMPLLDEGAVWADNAAGAAADADAVITMVSDTPDVRQVLLGNGGVHETARAGTVVVDMSTISPRATREMASALAEKAVIMLDAPVSGGVKGAIEGTLSIMVGGPDEALERVRPVFEAMGKNIVHCGGHGQGQMTKLCNQIAVANHMVAAAEAIVLARRSGLDVHAMIQAIGAGAAGSWAINVLGPKMADHDFSPGFMVKLLQKDLRLVMEAASELSVPLPGTAAVHQLYAALEAEGRGDEGTQALISVFERLAGL
jgi:3-hydroxyisobutyrate dehydrogenase-like beta-hydroxyacid dehydrogenase